jgi:hypothetical protein
VRYYLVSFFMSERSLEPATVLESEVDFIFSKIFGANAQPASRVAYGKFHIIYGPSLLARKRVDMVKVVSRGLDLEAVEFFLRTRYPGNQLTCKVWACTYLYEAQEGRLPRRRGPAQTDRMTGAISCLLMLTWFGLRSAVHWLKGAFQTYRHELL